MSPMRRGGHAGEQGHLGRRPRGMTQASTVRHGGKRSGKRGSDDSPRFFKPIRLSPTGCLYGDPSSK